MAHQLRPPAHGRRLNVDGHWRAILPDMKEIDDMNTVEKLLVAMFLAIAALSFSQEAFAFTSCTTTCAGNSCTTNCF